MISLIPGWLKVALLGGILIGGLQVKHWWETRSLNNQITELTHLLDQERVASAELRAAVSDVSANRDTLVSRIREQNSAIEGMKVQAKQEETAAVSRALRAVREGERSAAALRSTTTNVAPGHNNMNRWMEETFAK